MSVKPIRHIAKAITWRITATTITTILVLLLTGSIKFGLTIGIVDLIIKFVAYYVHERLWYRTKFGVDIPHCFTEQEVKEFAEYSQQYQNKDRALKVWVHKYRNVK